MAKDGTQMDAEQVRSLLRAKCKETKTISAWADANGMSTAYVSDVLRRRRDPGDSILSALGLRKVVKYERVRA
jgi:hypothetical protein